MRHLSSSPLASRTQRQHALPVLLLFWVGLYLIAGSSALGNTPDEDEGLAHYQRAMELYQENHYEEAKAAIERAHASDPRSVYLGFRAWCVFRLGDQAEGLRIMVALSESEDLSTEETLDFQAAATRMQDRAGTASLNLNLRDPDVEVLLDNISLEKKKIQSTIQILPGSHTVVFQKNAEKKRHDFFVQENKSVDLVYPPDARLTFAKDFEGSVVHVNGKSLALPESLSLDLQAGEYHVQIKKNAQTLFEDTLSLNPGEERALSPKKRIAVVAPPRRVERQRSWVFPTLLAALGAGLIGVGAYSFHEALRGSNALADLKPAADNRVHSRSQRDAFQDYHNSQESSRNATVLFTLGAAAVGGAAFWVWWSPPSQPKPQMSVGPASLHFRASF